VPGLDPRALKWRVEADFDDFVLRAGDGFRHGGDPGVGYQIQETDDGLLGVKFDVPAAGSAREAFLPTMPSR
jgi:hypothetical protein